MDIADESFYTNEVYNKDRADMRSPILKEALKNHFMVKESEPDDIRSMDSIPLPEGAPTHRRSKA